MSSARSLIAAVGSIGSAGLALLASACCVGPAVVSVVGVSAAIALAGLVPYRLPLLLAALAFAGYGMWRAYGRISCHAAPARRRAERIASSAAALTTAIAVASWALV